MEDGAPVYKLIHAVDPTKVNVPIRERFAKLTLSSNKKKKANTNEDGKERNLHNDPQQVEKRQSASRNLLDLLTASQVDAAESDWPKSSNPLLQSDSSSKSSNETHLEDETQVNVLEEQLGNVHIAAEQSEIVMEHLVMSEDECSLLTEESTKDDAEECSLLTEEGAKDTDDMVRQIAALSQQVSTLTVSSQPTMISGTTTSHERTQLVSTESQKMSSNSEPLRPSQMPPKLRLEKDVPPAELDSEISIMVPSETDDEEDDSETQSAITISDSTVSSAAVPDDAAVSDTDYDVVTSIIPDSGETADALLPITFSNDKADRMEAFLRDVSQVLRERQTNSREDTILETERTATQNPSAADLNVKPVVQMSRAQQLRTADTESMCSYKNEVFDLPLPNKPTEREQRLLALNDTVAMSQSHSSSIFNAPSIVSKTPRAAPVSTYQRREDDAAKRLAHDETEVNTLVSSAWNNSNASFTSQNSVVNESHNSTPTNSLQRSGGVAEAEDSIVISETSSEGEDDSVHILTKATSPIPTPKTHVARTPVFKTPTSRTRTPTVKTPTSHNRRTPKKSTTHASSNEIVVSEKPATSADSTSPYESQLSQIQMSMGSINISAKINIKIHISQQISTDEEEDQLSSGKDDSDDDDENDDNNCEQPPSLPSTANNSNSVEKIDKEVIQKQKSPVKSTVPVVENADDIEQATVEDGAFLTHAELLLNQLYGKAWQTPDVIKTLRRTSANQRTCSILSKTAGKAETPKSIKNKKKQTEETPPRAVAVDESVLVDDFSIFRRNIVKTNLDSTRLVTPKNQKGSKPAITTRTEPRRQAPTQNRKEMNSVFKVPQTEVKRPERPVLTTKTGRVVKALHLQKLIDSDSADSSGVNASDDSDADQTKATNTSTSSKDSWKMDDDDSEDNSDFEIEMPTKLTRTKRKTKTATRKTRGPSNKKLLGAKEDLIYLDLSQNEVSVLESIPDSPPANHDEVFSKRLQDILHFCRPENKPKIEATPKTTIKPKRKLFNAKNIYDIDDGENNEPLQTPSKPETPKQKTNTRQYEEMIDLTTPIRNGTPVFNKPLEAIKNSKPTPRSNGKAKTAAPDTPKSAVVKGHANLIKDLLVPEYSFLKSLDAHLLKTRCHPEALIYRENYRQKKEELAEKLYELFNEKIFDNRLSVPLSWNKKLQNTAGRCLNRKKLTIRSSTVELSEKVLSSADRLRCTLVHELCHAATWVFNGENGHGSTWKSWAQKSNSIFPELPKIGVCHNYEIEYKYTYKCTLCGAKSHAHSKSKKVERIRCSYCYGSIEIFLNKKDKDGNIMPTPVREPTGFAKFVKDNYKQHKREDRKHADVMKLLGNEFAALKVAGSAN